MRNGRWRGRSEWGRGKERGMEGKGRAWGWSSLIRGRLRSGFDFRVRMMGWVWQGVTGARTDVRLRTGTSLEIDVRLGIGVSLGMGMPYMRGKQ